MSRELDIKVLKALHGVRKVYGYGGKPWTPESKNSRFDCYYIPSGKPWRTHHIDAAYVPFFSTDISAAMTVVFAMRARGFLFELQNPPGWLSVVKVEQAWAALFWIDESQRHTMAATAPEAICRAALAALSTAQNGHEQEGM